MHTYLDNSIILSHDSHGTAGAIDAVGIIRETTYMIVLVHVLYMYMNLSVYMYVEDNLSTTIATARADSPSCLCVYVTAYVSTCLRRSTYLGTSLEVEGEHVLAGARLALTHQEDAVPAAELLLH